MQSLSVGGGSAEGRWQGRGRSGGWRGHRYCDEERMFKICAYHLYTYHDDIYIIYIYIHIYVYVSYKHDIHDIVIDCVNIYEISCCV